jgi:hypothetical protein
MKKASAEYKYQFIKLVKSGRTLREAKAMAKAVAVGLSDEYANAKHKDELLRIKGGLERLTMTGAQARSLMAVKFSRPKNLGHTRSEFIAQWVTGKNPRTPINWNRDGNLVRKGRPNKPRPGSSKRIIGKSRIIGSTKTLQRLEQLLRNLQNLQRRGKLSDNKLINATKKAVKTQISALGTPPNKY